MMRQVAGTDADMAEDTTTGSTYTLTLRDTRGGGVSLLKLALKVLGRRFGFQCVRITEQALGERQGTYG